MTYSELSSQYREALKVAAKAKRLHGEFSREFRAASVELGRISALVRNTPEYLAKRDRVAALKAGK